MLENDLYSSFVHNYYDFFMNKFIPNLFNGKQFIHLKSKILIIFLPRHFTANSSGVYKCNVNGIVKLRICMFQEHDYSRA